jgi:predicted RNase H-like HicB family nuclease
MATTKVNRRKYRVVLIESSEGFAVSCPTLRGCHSQGATRAEALANIREAIREYLAVEQELGAGLQVTETTVLV